jgi:tetratricopeptide (TPR) repeat protein
MNHRIQFPRTAILQALESAVSVKRTIAAGIAVCLASLLPAAGHGAYHDVVAAIQTKLKSQPENAELHFKLAQAHIGHDEWRACLDEVEQVERLAPGAYPTGYLRGLALHTGGREQEAKDTLDAFLAKNPDHSQALATRARTQVKLGLPDQAVADFEKALKTTASPDSELVLDLAAVYNKLGRTADASRAIDRALPTSGNTSALLRRALEIEVPGIPPSLALMRCARPPRAPSRGWPSVPGCSHAPTVATRRAPPGSR